jgi:single-stranded-DNA-specific exonuclease
MHTQNIESLSSPSGIFKDSTEHLSPVLIKILAARGYDTPEKRAQFFSWSLKDLPSFDDLLDLQKAGERILLALAQKELIAIYGDYDVDGTTSCALLFHFFKSIGVEVKLYQPSRFVEGYGLHLSSIDQALADQVKVLITVDCGITSEEAALSARERGIDLIITDHHNDLLPQLPSAFAIVNPNRKDEPKESELRKLSGAGVAFVLAYKVRALLLEVGKPVPSIYSLLQFVAIGTIADLVPLNILNLVLVRHGLKQICDTQYQGLQMFFPPIERSKGFIASEKISFLVGPLINSKGRLEHPERALKLLIADDNQEAFSHHTHLEVCNQKRKEIQFQVFEEAKNQLLSRLKNEDPKIMIAYQKDWHEGVIGIVASRVVETFKRPALIFTSIESNDGLELVKASARTAGTLDLFSLLSTCQDLFIKFGGHKAAAGLTMEKKNLLVLEQRLEKLLAVIPISLRTVTHQFDLTISASDINAKLCKELEKLEPFGNGNPKPIFRCGDLFLKTFSILKEKHVRWEFVNAKNPQQKISGISFNYYGAFGKIPPEEIFKNQEETSYNFIFEIGINRFNGNEFLQLKVIDAEV